MILRDVEDSFLVINIKKNLSITYLIKILQEVLLYQDIIKYNIKIVPYIVEILMVTIFNLGA